jgi:RsiW-degrading membrane proteinase PrsW (M82 family)
MAAVTARPTHGSDRALAVIAGASVAVSVAAVAARFAGLMPEGPSTLIVVIGAAIGLKVALKYASRSASDAARARVMNLVSTIALAISALTAIASLPRITKLAGMHPFVLDMLAQLWTVAILWVVAGPVRTMGWRVFIGAWLTGFLGLTALARLVGTPLIDRMGASSIFAAAVWVPITEELIKLLPVILVLVMAMRRPRTRPSVLDLVLLAAFSGAGFASYESATLGRGTFSLLANPVLSLSIPSLGKATVYGWTVAQSGHLVHTAVIALGVAFAFMYPRQLAHRWIVPTAAIVAVLIEHCSQNAMFTGHLNEVIGKLAIILTLGGRLSSLMLIGGVGYVMMLEWRAVADAYDPGKWLRLTQPEANRRMAMLAAAQTRGDFARSADARRVAA